MKNFIARQPIFHQDKDVLGYEILFRGGPENYFSDTGVDASAVALDNVLQFGIDRVASGHLAFINCSRDFLLRDHLTLLPPDRVVGEILETVIVDDEVLEACRRLKGAGYRLALDDFVDSPAMAPLVELADYIKVDFLATPEPEQARLARELSRRNVRLIAEKVETQEAFQKGMSMGYRYFQGHFFCQPQMAERRSIPAQKFNYLRILQIANQPDIDIEELAAAIKLEASLIYRLLRFLNSPVFGLRTNVGSISHALSLLGENGIRKWISLTSLAVMGEDKSTELVTVPLVRARFCELIAAITSLRARSHELFLMGLLSGMDAILDTPMSTLLDGMPVSDDIREALLDKGGQFRDVYEIVSNYETGAWAPMLEAVGRSRVSEEVVPELFLKSLDWANQVMSTN
jgi:EAL and modified HD-GYP domain-containing signal transduction protein